MQTEFHQYVRDSKRQKIGVLYASISPGGHHVFIGWSACHRLDKFDPKRGLETARVRAFRWRFSPPVVLPMLNGEDIVHGVHGIEIPIKIAPAMERFLARVVSHFKQINWEDQITRHISSLDSPARDIAYHLLDIVAAQKVELMFPAEASEES